MRTVDTPGTFAGYSAQAFKPGQGGKVAAGRLRVTADSVLFEETNGSHSFPLAGLQLRRGGHNNEQIFLEHPASPEWSIYSADPALLRDPILSAHPQFAAVLKSLEKGRSSLSKAAMLALLLAAIMLAAIVAIWTQRGRIAETIAGRIPVAWEQTLGEQLFEQVRAAGVMITNSPWQPALDQVIAQLRSALPQSDFQLQFHVMQDTNVNAFAIPGGHIVILTGLLEQAETSEEIAGVLAHEIAHVTRRHSLRNLIQSAGLIVAVQALFGDASGAVALASQSSRFLVQQKFSRDFEREADDTGWSYLLNAKIDPRGMIRFFEKMKKLAAASDGAALEKSVALLTTHPTSDERIARLQAKWAESGQKITFTRLAEWKKQ